MTANDWALLLLGGIGCGLLIGGMNAESETRAKWLMAIGGLIAVFVVAAAL